MDSKADILTGAVLVKKCERGTCNLMGRTADNLH